MHKEAFLARLDSLYEDYLSTVLRLERDRKLGDGIFGIRPGPADDPCHDRFAADLQGLLEELDSDGADSSLRREVMEKIFAAPLQSPDPKSSYWMLVAVQGLTRILISGLSSEDADALAEKTLIPFSTHEGSGLSGFDRKLENGPVSLYFELEDVVHQTVVLVMVQQLMLKNTLMKAIRIN